MKEDEELKISITKLFKERVKNEAQNRGLKIRSFIKHCLEKNLNSDQEYLEELKNNIIENTEQNKENISDEITEDEKIEAVAEKIEKLHGDN